MYSLIPIGHSSKSRGINGVLKLQVDEIYVPDLLKARALFIDNDGSQVPFIIESIEDAGSILVKLEEINSPEELSALVSRQIFLESSALSDEALADQTEVKHELVGYHIHDQNDNRIAVIEEIIQYPSQLLAQINYNGTEHLIPIHTDLILEMNDDDKVIKLEIAEGLLG